jgi:hypothetical protein
LARPGNSRDGLFVVRCNVETDDDLSKRIAEAMEPYCDVLASLKERIEQYCALAGYARQPQMSKIYCEVEAHFRQELEKKMQEDGNADDEVLGNFAKLMLEVVMQALTAPRIDRLDPIDWKIITILRNDPDLTDDQAARRIGVQRQALNARKKKIEAAGIRL